jgi:gluconolactonase
MASNPVDGFRIDRDAITYLGHDLQRPECVLAEPDGSLWSADARGGVMQIRPDGRQSLITQSAATGFASVSSDVERFTTGTLPNGLAFARNGDIVASNFGTDRLELMTRGGQTRVLVDRIDGQPIGKVNFVLRDSRDRYWITVSTRTQNWMNAIRPDLADGYVALYEPERGQLRVVADGFRFTNEIRFDAAEEWLYVVETCGPCITRLRATPDGTLTDRETFGPADHGAPIDGIAFDSYGNLWGTHIMADRVFVLTPEGELRIVLDDAPPDASKRMMEAFYKGQVTPELLLACGGTIAPWMASLTFFGRDLRQVAIGSLKGTRLAVFTAPVSGLPMTHWNDTVIAV